MSQCSISQENITRSVILYSSVTPTICHEFISVFSTCLHMCVLYCIIDDEFLLRWLHTPTTQHPINKQTMSGTRRYIRPAKRHRIIIREVIEGITRPAIRRLARRGGVKRISLPIYEATRGELRTFLKNVIRDAVTYTQLSRRKTVTAKDVVYALKRQGRTLYGFGG